MQTSTNGRGSLTLHLVLFCTYLGHTQCRPAYRPRTYDPTNPKTTCYDYLYEADGNADNILQNYEYINFIADLSEGGIDVQNYKDLPFNLKVNFGYLSCQCKFPPVPSENGGEGCCSGPEAGMYLFGSDANNLLGGELSFEEEAYMQTVCSSSQEAIEYDRIDILTPTVSPVDSIKTDDAPTTQPTIQTISVS